MTTKFTRTSLLRTDFREYIDVVKRYVTATYRRNWLFSFGIIAGCLALFSCGAPPEEHHTYPFRLDLSRPDQQTILELQDRQQADSLIPYFKHPDPSLRYRAAMAFASFRDSSVIPRLALLLSDPDLHVREAAAYALGQSGARQAEEPLVKAFSQNDSLSQIEELNGCILEAVGKTGSLASLKEMSSTTTYLPSDVALVTGQARGIYRFALRGITDPAGTERMVEIVTDDAMPQEARVMAANYFLRARGIATVDYLKQLGALAERDPDPRIRMCLVVGVAKSQTPEARALLSRILSKDRDYRVKCNILRALQYFPYAQVKEMAFQQVGNPNVHIARCAAAYLLDYGTERDAARYRALSKGKLPWEVKTQLYGAANRYLTAAYAITKGNLNTELLDWFHRSMNPYEKAAVLNAYARDALNYEKIPDLTFHDESPVVRTAGVEALGSILSDRYFTRDIGTRIASTRRTITNALIEAMKQKDPGMVAAAALILANPDNKLYDYTRAHMETLESTLIALDLPAQIEAYDALADCLAKLKNEAYTRETVAQNHPVPWDLVSALPDTVKVEVVTSRGNFRMDLFTQLAPATVMNFVQLTRDRFFNGKNFHRVVPNFVIQGGCPRGDGYGSLDYTIRSELPPAYYDDEGYVGMASAGNHTESTQWFVTHSPTPHLDGNYTLFGKVYDGMSVVHAIQIGDEIREVNIL